MKINPSLTLQITAKAKQMKAQGLNVISLAAGEPDFTPPEEVKQAAKQAVDDNFSKYTQASGIPELKQAVVKKLKRDNHIDYTPENIIISNGGKQVLFNALFYLGGEIIIPTPYWLTYPEQVKMASGQPVFCQTDNNQIKADLIAEKITPNTKAIILNSPNNPTGAVIPRTELQRIADLAVNHKLIIISDEVYEYFTYDQEHISIASLNNEIKNLTLTVNAISKSYGVPGWRIGYGAGSSDLIKEMAAIQGQVTSNPNSIAQKAAVKALELIPDPNIISEYKQRRDLMTDELKSMGLDCPRPQGAFYCWAKINDDSLTFCSRLLEESKLAVIPGEPFGDKNHIRLSYAINQEIIKDAMRRLRGFLDNKFLQNKNMSY
ncbi:MAG: pyridoxal phosphate-dependent aminotransferase [Nanoarchaeota archaeon]|nr:pyridoxal phosphate-dependent aminotransferase [Nanoarchaeota archaeon]